MNRRELAEHITKSVTNHYVKKVFSVHKEFGVGRRGARRMDLLAVNMKGKFICVEVKTCRQDYTSDSKWHEYLPYCNQMYIAIPRKLFDSKFYPQMVLDVKPHKVGIIVVSDNPREGCLIVKSAGNRTIDDKVMMNHFVKMAWRGGESIRTRKIEKRERKK